ncbi:DUF2383 domain-containing protein [Limnoglobus roseus]|uniref:DUF2383 domain-containing protein n=1 Tax=Limnoglobus roseus TaxID=2598579 RepID=A0A5C1AHM3_9BACT|nr:DUF2383 domain-containing protein [Limnoglobus roseus]QEL16468.1 hypothetical protein PX52LOC_03423 [Limnoglobus roseus]
MTLHTAEYKTTEQASQFTDSNREAMNSLLRGELSAAETYEQAIPKFEDMNVRSTLSHIRDEHRQAIDILQSHIRHMGGTPSEKSGIWGTMVTTLTEAAKILGPQTVLGTLQQGEEVGIGSFEAMIEDQSVPTECKNVIHTELLPRCKAHIQTLDTLSKSLESKS